MPTDTCPICEKPVHSASALAGHLEIGHGVDPDAVLGIRRRRDLRGTVRRVAGPARHLVAVAVMVGAVAGGAWINENAEASHDARHGQAQGR